MIFKNKLTLGISLVAIAIGLAAGTLGEISLKFLILLVVGFMILGYFLINFEQAVLSLLILRSSLDIFESQQIPALFAIGIDVLTILYVLVNLFLNRPIYTDRFWWIFAAWITLQGIWVILLPLGSLGSDTSLVFIALREWIRLFSFLMVYLLVMQLKGKLSPNQIINGLFWSLALPLAIAVLQLFLPASLIPSILRPTRGLLEGTSRISGTFAHSAAFAKFLLLFITLTYWKIIQNQRSWFWIALLGILTFFLTTTVSVTTLAMLVVFLLVSIAPRIRPSTLVGGILIFLLVYILFVNTEYGQERISSLFETPLLNPDIDVSRAILMQEQPGESNSFNWRIQHWTELLKKWEKFPLLGYGLAASQYIGSMNRIAHNDYVSFLVETGIIGLVLFITFFSFQIFYLFNLMKSVPKGSPKQQFCLVLISILVAWLVGMCTDNIMRTTHVLFYWYSLLAIAGWDWGEEQMDLGKTLNSASSCESIVVDS
jgi:O-antigen ligase